MAQPFHPFPLVTLMAALTSAPAAMPQAAQPKISMSDVNVAEGNSGTINATIFVSLSRSSS
jgi:hypothetical protein